MSPPIMSDDMLLATMIVLPFAGSLVAALLPTNARNAEAWLAGAIALAGLIIASLFHAAVADGRVVRVETDWLPQLGLTFVLRLDGFAWSFAALITGIGPLIVLYARYYMSPADPVPRFFAFLLAFMDAMLGVVLSGNLIQLVFFWELTSLFSFLLIGYWHHKPGARDAAGVALTVTATGGLCLFAGVLVLATGLGGGTRIPSTTWVLLATLLLSGLAILIAMTRAGIRSLWASIEREVPRVRVIELAPIAVLLGLCFALTVQAGPVMRYMQATADALHAPGAYVRDVRSVPPAPRP